MTQQGQLGFCSGALQGELDRRIERVLRTGKSAWLDEWQLELLRILAVRKGREHAISIAQIQRLVAGGDRFITHREIKAAVKELIERFAIPIGSARGTPHGYFLIVTPDDQAGAIRPLVGELKSLARRIRALSGKSELARMWGQLQLELDQETNPPQRHRDTEAA